MKNGLNMPTPEEIEKIAREFAMSRVKKRLDKIRAEGQDVIGDETNHPMTETLTHVYSMFLQWLTKDYCIVPKSQLKELYDCYRQHEQTCKAKGLHNATLIAIGSQATMCDIFGKSLFEEEK